MRRPRRRRRDWQQPAERVTGIGGVFFKAKDPRTLGVWYRDHLGLVPEPAAGNNPIFQWRNRDDPAQVGNTVWSLFPRDTKYFGPGGSTFMLNYRVRNLDRMLAQLKAGGVRVEPENRLRVQRPLRVGHRSRGQPDRAVGAQGRLLTARSAC